MTRLIKAFWFLSLIVGLAVLLYIYAGLPEQVAYQIGEAGGMSYMGREAFFYLSLAALVIANFSLYTVSRSLRYRRKSTNTLMTNWQLSLAGVFNFFFIVIWNFISLFNSGENFNYDNFGYMIYVALGLIVIWMIALPVLLIRHQASS
ncbi:hypothetical protein GCM10009122_51800 [Fulvivirga kasyanovii]|uniref:DUF4293 family protein n=1 Tax=Fulvivirga kasyanovii TaxID=396812 RepID=A0ABW9RRJ2_9BACT|nr:hypothetical protein [Fulvivirga kasyanovii]MTI26541.1 hypothetical protein [Fulvivirga kasyanovii]